MNAIGNIQEACSMCIILGVMLFLYANNAAVAVANAQGQQILLVRLPSNTLLKYTAFKDVSILHFHIPTDTRTALFSFKAYEESKSAFQRVCEPKDITLYLKSGSYPVISPENITFPKHFLNADQRFEIYHLQFKSDGTTKRLNIDGPQFGNWFGVAFISWTDPNNDRIEQQGLAASCETILLSEMSVVPIVPIIINVDILHTNTLQSNVTQPIAYKFFVPNSIEFVTWQMSILPNDCFDCPNISIYIQANGLPNAKQFIDNGILLLNQQNEMNISFYPQPNTWHFIDIEFIIDNNNNNNNNDENSILENVDNTINSNNITNINNTLNNNSSSVNITKQMVNETIYKIDFSVKFSFHINEKSDEINVHLTETTTEPSDTTVEQQKPEPEQPLSSTTPSTPVTTEENSDLPVININNGDDDDDELDLPARNLLYYPLLRQTYREFFMFDYDLIPDVNNTVPAFLNLTAGTPSGFRFDIGDIFDIGGTLSFAVAMKDTLKDSTTLTDKSIIGNAIAEKLIDNSNSNKNNTKDSNNSAIGRSNQTIVICMRLNEPGIPTWPDKCIYGRQTLLAASVINNTNDDTSTGLIHVPFPEAGRWYITMGLFCHGAETTARITIIDSVKDFIKKNVDVIDEMHSPCACANQSEYYKKCLNNNQCLLDLRESETLKVKECLMDIKCTKNYKKMTEKFEIHHKYSIEQSVAAADASCNASIVFTISSSPCVAGRCGRYGRCYHYMSGGFVFSTCMCIKGYRGWDCTEDSQVPSSFSILLALLLLTLSNLLFIPSIYFAIRRKYYTESVIYFFAMFFSIFYHACDSGEDEYSFCLVKISVLQFCDFYCGLLAIWVTLIAMAHLRQTFVSLLHMFGAILLAFGTELNKQSLWVFLAPALTGLCIISVSWGLRCRHTKKWFPARKYLAVFFPIGMVLVMIGLVCFAFLQTRQNYHIVHSIWHMVMALSILCLLPSRNSFLPKC